MTTALGFGFSWGEGSHAQIHAFWTHFRCLISYGIITWVWMGWPTNMRILGAAVISRARLRFFSWLKALCELVFVVFCDLIGACHNSMTKWWGGFIEGSNDQLAANTSASSRKISQVALQIYFEIFQSRFWLCKASDRIVPTTVSRMFLLFLPRLSCIQEKKLAFLFILFWFLRSDNFTWITSYKLRGHVELQCFLLVTFRSLFWPACFVKLVRSRASDHWKHLSKQPTNLLNIYHFILSYQP